MLEQLHIRNYAIIDKLDVNFANDLNIITGETGAGKSIIMGAIGLILGQRADTTVIRDEASKCSVEAQFNILPYKLEKWFEELDVDYEGETIIRREINNKGKSRAFINDTPVTLQTLKKLCSNLVDLNTQHHKFNLSEPEYQLHFLDILAEQVNTVEKYAEDFLVYEEEKRKLTALIQKINRLKKEEDYIQFQLNELNDAALEDPAELTNLENEFQILNNAEKIQQSLVENNRAIETEGGLIDQLNAIKGNISQIGHLSGDLEKVADRLDGLKIELEDIQSEIQHIIHKSEGDPQRLEEVKERVDLFHQLLNKHQVKDLEALIDLRTSFQDNFNNIDAFEEEVDKLTKKLSSAEQKLFKKAKQISSKRIKASEKFIAKIVPELKAVGLNKVTIQFEHTSLEELTESGTDHFSLLFSANPGSAAQPVANVASGGELSRLMLCVKNMMADFTALPTLIFDEIDAGISGETAAMVAAKMHKLSKKHQVLCITHLPQMASKGKQHFQVFKEVIKNQTFTRIKSLTDNERIEVIAKMVAGEKVNASALENAKSLLKG